MEETLLVQLARQGDEDAVDELFARVWPVVWHWAYAVTGDRSLADHVAQETIYRAFAALDRFDESRPFLPWLKRITVNRAIDELRHERRAGRHAQPSDAERSYSPLDERLESTPIVDAVRRLPMPQRVVIVLHYWLDCSVEEIASLLGIRRHGRVADEPGACDAEGAARGLLVTDDLERLLREAPGSFPRPGPGLTDEVRRSLLERLRRTARRRRLAVRLVPVVVVATAASAFALGHWVVSPAASASDSRSLLVRTTDPRPVTVSCPSGVMVDLDPAGRITVLQYVLVRATGVWTPTGATIAYIDAKTRSLTHVCPRTRAPKLRPNTLVGPWPRAVASRVLCYNPAPAIAFQIEVLPILNRARRQIGNRLLVVAHRQKIVDARITRRGGGVSLDPTVCTRNAPQY